MNYGSIISNELFAEVINTTDYIEYIIDWCELSVKDKDDIVNELFTDAISFDNDNRSLAFVVPKNNGIPAFENTFVCANGYLVNMDKKDSEKLINYVINGTTTGNEYKDYYLNSITHTLRLTALEKIHMLNLVVPNQLSSAII